MQIVVSHLTRMQPGYICVAVIEVATGKHVRPVTHGRLPASLLACEGGPFDMAACVELGPVSRVGESPELEDHRCNFQRARRTSTMSAREFWERLEEAAQPSLSAIFGDELEASGLACVVKAGCGQASLGCFAPKESQALFLDERGRVRMRIADGVFAPNVSVTDLRLYQADHVTPDHDVLAHVVDRIRSGVPMLLSVGLTRAFSPDGGEPKHWLQVNNIHFQDNPTWQLG